MSSYYIYISALFAFSAFAFFFTVMMAKTLSANFEKWEKLPRNILFGVILAGIDFSWCIPHAKPIAPDSIAAWLIPVAIVCLWLSYQFLDYLFARALGGFLILLAHYFLYSSFYFKAPAKPFFSVLCYVMGTLGIFFCGKPHLMRDLIRKLNVNSKWRMSALLLMLVYAFTFLIIAVLHVT